MDRLGNLKEAEIRVGNLRGSAALNKLAETLKEEEKRITEANKISYEDWTRLVTI